MHPGKGPGKAGHFISVAGAFLSAFLSSQALADRYIQNIWSTTTDPVGYVFPNWVSYPAGSFEVWLCAAADCGAGAETLRGLTVVNFGTAVSGTDIKAVYWRLRCGGVNTLYSMTYVGPYAEDAGTFPAWTWAGTSPDISGCGTDLCGSPACGRTFFVDLYIDAGPCPAPQSTVQLGFPVNSTVNPAWWGSMSDNYGYTLPWGDTWGGSQTIIWALKSSDRQYAAPGDTVEFTVTYGRPGTAALSSIDIMDTQPPYTHYVPGSSVPAPDAFWDPNPGPPAKLRWSGLAGGSVNGGPTSRITFSLTVDWGNGDSFEAGSGDDGAPEGARLANSAQVFFNGTTCGTSTVVNPPVTMVVRRYLMWMLGDNDIMLAGGYGVSDDEVIYSIFIKNASSQKTWWDVHIWDTVPQELNAWAPGYGFDDPCAGWTMTPSGCAAASPGAAMSAGRTLLSWKLDMPPDMTLELRWKARLLPSVMEGSTVINRVVLREYGHTRIVDGTGNAGAEQRFTHVAPVVLRTTYISYVAQGWGYGEDGWCGFWIVFYPLHKSANFELRGLEYTGAGWATTGGVSASIGTLMGSCLGGMGCAGSAGCGAERAPANFSKWQSGCAPNTGDPGCPAAPLHYIYKLTANAPVLWSLFTNLNVNTWNDAHTYTPSTSLTFCGLMHYTFLRRYIDSPGTGDAFNILNTSMAADGTHDPDLATTVHVFRWDDVARTWEHLETYDIDKESQVARPPVASLAEEGHYRIVSSEAKLIVRQSGLPFESAIAGARNTQHMAPNREKGTLVGAAGGDYTFYVFPGTEPDKMNRVVITNTGATAASYTIERYVPLNPFNKPASVPASMADTSGTWVPAAFGTVDPGLIPGAAVTGNPHVYGNNYDTACTFDTPDGGAGVWRITQTSGGPIEINSGNHVISPFGGTVIHASDGRQVGTEFWVSSPFTWVQGGSSDYCNWYPYAIEMFAPKSGMAVRAVSNDGFSATYTTSGSDQCVAFRGFTDVAAGAKRNIRINLLAGGTQGNLIAMYNSCVSNQKFFTAPFLATGVHYSIIAPPVVYLGQSFWITVIVLDSGGSTKTDYAGTTSFTSTDPGAKIEGKAMDTYNYTWKGCGSDCGVKMFFNVTFSRVGLQTLVGSDTIDGSINGMTTVLVVAADVKLEKRKRLSVAASGDTVQFQICWSNDSSATAFSFTITDAVPMGTTYVPQVASTMLCGTSAPVPGLTVWYSTATTTTPPGTFTSVPGTGSPLANSRWLRWTIRDVYVRSTGCVCFRVSVN